MNRYKKKVTLKPEASDYILPIKAKPLRPDETAPEIQTINPAELYGNSNPLELEIGFGTGTFMLEYLKGHPSINYLAVEITKKMVELGANNLSINNLTNGKIVSGDGRIVMADWLPAGSVDRVHVYFPDPWTKKRHIKRRVINDFFFNAAWRVLKTGGRFNFFTDHKEYYEYFLEHKERHGLFTDDSIQMDEYVPTAYEMKWVKMGRAIYRTILRKEEIK